MARAVSRYETTAKQRKAAELSLQHAYERKRMDAEIRAKFLEQYHGLPKPTNPGVPEGGLGINFAKIKHLRHRYIISMSFAVAALAAAASAIHMIDSMVLRGVALGVAFGICGVGLMAFPTDTPASPLTLEERRAKAAALSLEMEKELGLYFDAPPDEYGQMLVGYYEEVEAIPEHILEEYEQEAALYRMLNYRYSKYSKYFDPPPEPLRAAALRSMVDGQLYADPKCNAPANWFPAPLTNFDIPIQSEGSDA